MNSQNKTNYFASNETLECCDVSVSQQGNITIDPKMYNQSQMNRLGAPQRALRGRVRETDGFIRFDPYEQGTRPSPYETRRAVGCCRLSVMANQAKLEMTVPRVPDKDFFLRWIEAEWRSLVSFLDGEKWYDRYIAPQASDSDCNAECSKVDGE